LIDPNLIVPNNNGFFAFYEPQYHTQTQDTYYELNNEYWE
ncbi:MAG: hypothetical protein RLZ33_1825, partial [Bacteroidota bacterium]